MSPLELVLEIASIWTHGRSIYFIHPLKTMVRKLYTGGASTNGDIRRLRQRQRETVIIDLTSDDEDYETPQRSRRRY
ncbi:hypothetical protein ZOSMA_387G00040 [Zostera marina]|uniref:Uncharacterized protein n=1 Tax=Zostera marina TaxID=29655 RepID=A0A0K9P7A9_ZOSMR|nr:hypothetical protein ZOSMA_387G00040 [Zostera marina]